MPYLPYIIARRYLFAKKSHNVINIISAISAIGMAIGTAALIIILSVYNGFDKIVRDSMSGIEPDILISPSKGKTFKAEGEAFEWAAKQDIIYSVCGVLEDNVYINYDGRNGVATAKGVDANYETDSPIRDKITSGEFSLHDGDVAEAVVGAGLAYKLGINPNFLSAVDIYYPARDRQFSLSNPAASLDMIKVWPSGTFAINGEIDDNLIFISMDKMRELTGYEGEVSGVEIRFVKGASESERKRVTEGIAERLDSNLKLLNRFQQNESLYKMMKYEKAAVYLILIFVIIIIAFNIFSSLSMLIIEKEEDIGTLRSLGASDKLIRHIFILEGWLISLLGMVVGVIIGLAVVLIQQKTGFVKMPGGFGVVAYPVVLRWTDVIITAISVAIVGYILALLPVRRLKSD